MFEKISCKFEPLARLLLWYSVFHIFIRHVDGIPWDSHLGRACLTLQGTQYAFWTTFLNIRKTPTFSHKLARTGIVKEKEGIQDGYTGTYGGTHVLFLPRCKFSFWSLKTTSSTGNQIHTHMAKRKGVCHKILS